VALEDELFLMELNLPRNRQRGQPRQTERPRPGLPRRQGDGCHPLPLHPSPDSHSGHLETEFVREFPSLPRVEGIAVTHEGRTFYVTDEDEGVHLRLTRFLAG
jgi:hypothetical protein